MAIFYEEGSHLRREALKKGTLSLKKLLMFVETLYAIKILLTHVTSNASRIDSLRPIKL